MKLIFIFLLLSVYVSSLAQSNAYLSDLDTLYKIIRKTPSYRDQIKGEAKKSYETLLDQLKKDSTHNIDTYTYFYNLAQLLFPIRDNHLGFYQLINNDFFKDANSYGNYLSSEEFTRHPKFAGNLDSLQQELSQKPIDSIEGIYYLDTFLTIGLYHHSHNEFRGIVLSSTITVWHKLNWEKGEIAIHLYEHLPKHFRAIYADPLSKGLIYFPNEKFLQQSLINSYFYGFFQNWNYTKKREKKDFVNLPKERQDYIFKELEPEIHYLHLKHFSSSDEALVKAKAFYDSIKNLPTTANLIVDLRNNEGGGDKASKQFYQFIKKYTTTGKVYVLINNRTISHGEIFTLQLKQLPNVITLGESTNGTLVYGNNYGRTEKLPSQRFQVYPTDMGGERRLIPFEVFGVKPDRELSTERDWVEQVRGLRK
jgi:hypothetical protein